MKIQGVEETITRLTRVHKRTSEAQREELFKAGEDVAKLASDNAPRDTGALENSIRSVPVRDDVRGRYSVYIGVDEKKLGEGYTKYGFRYDEHLHKKPFNLGPLSQLKQESGKNVGFEFLTRALRELEDGIKKKMEELAEKESLNV